MVLRSVPACMDSSDWLQGGRMQDSGFKALQDDMQSCPRSLMDRRLKPNGELALRCPRCDSPNTKFCYYNNYSLSQPRYFCKTCRRYWTKGGTLRNVPVGGGCRKNKRFKRTSDQPSQTDPSNEISNCSPPNLEQSSLNFAPVPSVYFTLLNGGADGLGVGYSSPSLQQQHNLEALKVAAAVAADRPVLTANCNSSRSDGMIMMEVPSTATGTATHEALASLSNLNTFHSPPNLITPSGPDQTATLIQINGDLSTLFEAAHHHHHENQQVPTSSPPTVSHVNSSERFNDVTEVNDHRLNSGFNDQDVQWHHHKLGISVEDHDNGQVLLPFDHEDHHQFRQPPPPSPPPPPHHDIKLTQLIMNGVQSPSGGGEICEENRPAANSYNWQLPISEGLLDTSANNINFWSGAGTWPDLSCYAPYTNPLI